MADGAESHLEHGRQHQPVTISRFMPTSRRIVQFSSGQAAPPGARIVYVDGAFDLFHVGHIEALRVGYPAPLQVFGGHASACNTSTAASAAHALL